MPIIRYLILADGFEALNAKTMTVIESDKAANWRVTDVASVHVESTPGGGIRENTGKGIPACRITLTR